MTVHVDGAGAIRGLRSLRDDLARALQSALGAAIVTATDDARATRLFNDVSGVTRGSIDGRQLGMRGFVQAGGAAFFLENGTKMATEMRTVRFPDGSFRRFVHPGIAARPFMAHARTAGELAAVFQGEFFADVAIRKHNG